MAIADTKTYLHDVIVNLRAQWPANHLCNVVCHGHSVPAGYFATPLVDSFQAYPHLLHRELKASFPCAVINVIVTAIGGETAASGAARFEREVLSHQPEVVTIDYSLNDRGLGLEAARTAWRTMIEQALRRNVKVILLTPTIDTGEIDPAGPTELQRHADQVRRLAAEYEVGLVDSLAAYAAYVRAGGQLGDLLSQSNHPNRRGHELVTRELIRWFPNWAP